MRNCSNAYSIQVVMQFEFLLEIKPLFLNQARVVFDSSFFLFLNSHWGSISLEQLAFHVLKSFTFLLLQLDKRIVYIVF